MARPGAEEEAMGIARNSISHARRVEAGRAQLSSRSSRSGSCAPPLRRRSRSQADNWPNTPVRHTLKQRVAPTVPSFAANLRGGVAVAGNTLETCPQNQPGNEVCAGNTYNNNDQNMVYVNVDPWQRALQLQQRQPDDPGRRTRRQGVPVLGGRPVAGRRQRSGQPNRQRRRRMATRRRASRRTQRTSPIRSTRRTGS